MEDYQSSYTGPEIDSGIGKANTATQPEDLGELATKDSVDYETEVTNKPTIPTVDVDKNYVDTELAKKENKITNENKLDYSLISNTPTIPAEVTEQTVAGWGFTKNTGDYTKPADGIPATDLTQAVQTILEKANATNLSTYEFNETDLGPTVLNYIATNNPDLLKVTTQQGPVQDYYKGQDRQYYCLIGEYLMVLTIEGSEGSYNLDVKSYNFDYIKEVSGTNDGTNWTSITIDGTTRNIPAVAGMQLIDTKTIDLNVDQLNPTIAFPNLTSIQPGHYYFVTTINNWGAVGNILEGIVEFTVFTGTGSSYTPGERNAHFGSGDVVYWQDGSSPSPTGTEYAQGVYAMMEMDTPDGTNYCVFVNFDSFYTGVDFSDGAIIKVYYKPL